MGNSNKIEKKDPTVQVAKSYLVKGKNLFYSSKYNDAIESFEKALGLKPVRNKIIDKKILKNF